MPDEGKYCPHHNSRQRSSHDIAGIVIAVVHGADAHQENGYQQPGRNSRQKPVGEHEDNEGQHDVGAGEGVAVNATATLDEMHHRLEGPTVSAGKLLHSQTVRRALRRKEQVRCVAENITDAECIG